MISKMTRRLSFLVSVIMVLSAISVFSPLLCAEERKISGTVKDQENKLLTDVRIVLKNTGQFTWTDAGGRFSLTAPEGVERIILVFQVRGFHPIEKEVVNTGQEQEFRLTLLNPDRIYEKVSVTALSYREKTLDIPMAETSVSGLEIQEKVPESVSETLADTAGVHFIGKGGYGAAPSIRGLARRRVLMLVDGMRITGDRRVGVSASFIPPETAKRLEVVRSTASVLYGSDAIGGVINIMTRPESESGDNHLDLNSINLNYNSVNHRVNSGLSYSFKTGGWRISSGFQHTGAGDYSAPGGKILNSGYTLWAGVLDITHANENHEFTIGYLGGFGVNMGKPERANTPLKTSTTPSESEQFIRLGYTAKNFITNGDLQFSLYLNPSLYKLENRDLAKNTVEASDNRVLNFGLKIQLEKKLSEAFSGRMGLEWFGRSNLDMENRVTTKSGVSSSFPLADGGRGDYSVFAAAEWAAAPFLTLNGGLRYSYFKITGLTEGKEMEKDDGSYSFFLGATQRVGEHLSIFLNTGRAYRFPSLSESFYSGISGRRFVYGNPNLKAESSLNFDAGIKWSGDRYFLGLYLFTNNVDQLIERYKDKQDNYRYDNIDNGRISGVELEIQAMPVQNLSLYGHMFYYRGRSDAGDVPLNDVPAPRVFFGAKYHLNRFFLEGDFLHSFRQNDAGPAELPNDAYTVINARGGYYFSSSLFVYVTASNLLNETYYANMDPDIPLSKGFGLSSGIHLYF